MARLTESQFQSELHKFLAALEAVGETYRKGLPLATREQDKIRRHAVKHKLAKYSRDGWQLLPAGRRALAEQEKGG